MGYTLAEARTRLRLDFLDDPDDDGWTDTVLDRHLRAAHSRVLNNIIQRGYQGFRDDTEVVAVAGVVALATRRIVSVQQKLTSHLISVPHLGSGNRTRTYTGTDTFLITYDDKPTWPALNSTALVDHVGTTFELEELIILTAVRMAAVRDGEIPVDVRAMIDELYGEVLLSSSVHRVRRPSKPAATGCLAWDYDYTSQQIVLSYAD